jgi:zinc/manganese transport system substrate-binding protein
VKVEALAKGFQDPHFVEAKPSLITKLMTTDLFIQTGFDLEIGWAPLLVQGSRNPKIQPAGPGFLDASKAVHPLEVPLNPSRAMGDVHPGGNPHYLMDPENSRLVAREIAGKLSELSAKDAGLFQENLKKFEARLDENMKKWKAVLDPLKGTKFISYHRNLTYFADRFGFIPAGEIEPKPGIPPTAGHTQRIIALIKEQKIPLILTQPYYESRTPRFLADQTGAQVILFAMGPEGVKGVGDYFGAIDHNVRSVAQALAGQPRSKAAEK